MSLSLENLHLSGTGLPQQPASVEIESRLNISVVLTSVSATLAALKEAGELASRLGSRITLLVTQVVPYPLPLESSPVSVEWNQRRFRVIAAKSRVETVVRLYLCRDRLETLTSVLTPHSLVIVGGRKKWWWPTSEQTLAKFLRRAGHEVILKETR